MKKIRRFFGSIKNLIRWFPVIWKDKDWDSYFIFEILKTKLNHQSQYIGDRDFHTRAKYDAERMSLCVRLIEKLQNDFYEVEYLDYYRSDYNWVDSVNHPQCKEIKISEISNNLDLYFAKYKSVVKKIQKDKNLQFFGSDENDNKLTLAINLSRYNTKRAQELLFKILNRDISNWWD